MGFFSGLGDRVVGAPSILSADLARLAEEVWLAKDGGAELVHFDVMDNRFIPNLTMGPAVDGHLMVSNPDNLVLAFLDAGVNSMIVHQEVLTHPHRTLTIIRDGGCEAGVALNPTTHTLSGVRKARCDIQIDCSRGELYLPTAGAAR